MYSLKRNNNLLYLAIFPITYYSYNILKNISKKECYFCSVICFIDKNGCLKCWENILNEKNSNTEKK